MRILGVTAPYPGVRRVFEEGEKVGLMDVWVVGEGPKGIGWEQEVIILGSWNSDYASIVDTLKKEKKIGVLWTSSMGEVGLEGAELQLLWEVVNNKDISFIWFGDRSLGRLFDKGFYAPYPLDYKLSPIQPKQNIVTLFCPPTLKKNIYNQLVAIKFLQEREKELILHTNIPLDKSLIEFLGLRCVVHPWMQRRQYDELLASSRLNFAVSFAETFNYQCAEAIMLGTPCIVSSTVRLITSGTVWDNNSPEKICDTALDILYTPSFLNQQRVDLYYASGQNNVMLKKALTCLL